MSPFEFLSAVHRRDETRVREILADAEQLPALALALATLDRRDTRAAAAHYRALEHCIGGGA
jgi:hypothetical protein